MKGATIGVGHLISKDEFEKYKNGISEKEAMELFKKDSAKKGGNIVKKYVKRDLSQNEYNALVSLSYNIGEKGFANSSVLKLINDPNAKTPYKSLDDAWMAYNKSQGKRMKGLENRRKSELKLFHSGKDK